MNEIGYLLMVVTLTSASPTYFTIWLNNGQKLTPYLEQLNQQNDRFKDLLIVDSSVMPYVGDRTNVMLDRPLFQQARTNYPELSQKLTRLESVYDLIKSTNPAAASDILRFVGFLGLEGNEFIYHDVDVKINTGFTGNIPQPISSAIIGTRSKAHLGKNWVMRAISIPSREMSLDGSNVNTDLICVVRSESIELLSEYIENSCNYFDESLVTTFTTDGGRRMTLQEIVTSPDNEDKFAIEDITKYTTVIGRTDDDFEEKTAFNNGVTRRFLKSRMTFGASIAQYEKVLQKVFTNEYFLPIPESEEDDPYAIADRKFVFQNLILRGESRGILNFVRDFVADPKLYGIVSRKNNIDWNGDTIQSEQDVATVDAPPLDGEYEEENSDTDYEPYDEEAELRSINEGSINIDSSMLFCGRRRKRETVIICERNDPEKYTIKDDAIVFDGKEVSLVSRFVYIHDLSRNQDRIDYKRYKFSASEALKQKLTALKQQITTRIERVLNRPSGKQAMYELRNQYTRLVDTPKYIPMHGETSRTVRKFNRLSFGVGYATSLAFSAQFLAKAISSELDLEHKIALGTIGSVGLAELSYISTLKITGALGKSLSSTAIARLGGAFKIFNIATAVYFAVDSSISLSKNPGDLEAWWWLSRSITIFTPLNKLFLPLDITLIVSKQIVGASWDLSAQQNHIRMTQTDRSNYHALRFFGISTRWMSNIQNGGIFKTNIVNPTVMKLREMLNSDNYGVVGFPVSTICKSSERIIVNTFNDFETDINSVHMNPVPTVVDRLSSTRIETCLVDAETLCAPRTQSGWEWFVSIFAQASRVQNRGIDMGVGCILLDGTVLSGDACANIPRMKQDIRDREKVFVVIEGSDDYVLPFLSPSSYNFNFMSVANGSVEEFSSSDCNLALRWRSKIAPYVLVNPRKPNSGRIDYIGIPASATGLNVFKVIQNNPARIYVYKLNKNNRIDNFVVEGSMDNEFIVMEVEDNWRLKGIGALVIKPTNNSVIIGDEISVNDKIVAENSTFVVLSESKIVISPNKTSPFLQISSCSVIGKRGSNCIINVRGSNTMSFEELSMSYVYLDGYANITAENLAVITLTATSLSSAEIRAKPLARIKIIGLRGDWTINKTNDFVQINKMRLYSGSIVLSFQNYSVISTVGLKNDTVIFYGNIDATVVIKLNNPNILVVRNNSFVEYFSGSFTVPTIKHSFAIDGPVNVTIPYQTSKQLDFYGNGSINIANEMINCGNTSNCDLFAHRNCTESIRVCKW